MRARIRALERALVCQRAQVLIEPVAMDFIDAWEQALDGETPLPDELDLIGAVGAKRVPILTLGPLQSYLEQCRRDRRVPDLDRVVETIVHGYLQTRLKTRCRCR